ncbi:unnamed protein product [Ixodes persulcatus]
MLGAKYFQKGEGPFLPTNNRSMTKGWFKKLGDGRGEEMTRSWLACFPSKKAAFCICCLLFSRPISYHLWSKKVDLPSGRHARGLPFTKMQGITECVSHSGKKM